MVVIRLWTEIWCLAPHLPEIQAISAHRYPQHCLHGAPKYKHLSLSDFTNL